MPAEKPLRFTFHHSERLHLQKDFQRVFSSGRKLAHPALFIYIFPRPEGSGVCRLGLVTSRKVGKAVDRNRLKRRLRELFRLNKHLLKPGLDILFVLKAPATAMNYAQIEEVVMALFRQGVGIELMKDPARRIDFPDKAKVGAHICAACRPKGLIIRPLGNVIILMPPLSITKREITKMVAIVKESIADFSHY